MKNIVILDYGIGNVRSVRNAIHAIGASAVVSYDEDVISGADALIVPGVGAFASAMSNLRNTGLLDQIQCFVTSKRPVLGICLGMQILFDQSREFGVTAGLGLLRGTVDIIPINPNHGRLPHISWSKVKISSIGFDSMFSGMQDDELRFYFIHSYAATEVPTQYISGTTDYLGFEIVASVQCGNIWGTQFHPEKSGPNGLKLLRNFINQC